MTSNVSTLKYFHLFEVKNYEDFKSSLKEATGWLKTPKNSIENRTEILQQICDKIFSQSSYVDRWMKENSQSALDWLIPVEKLSQTHSVTTDRLSIILTQKLLEIMRSREWRYCSKIDVLEKATSYLDLSSLFTLSASHTDLYKSTEIFLAILGKMQSTPIIKSLVPHSAFFYRNLAFSGRSLHRLAYSSNNYQRNRELQAHVKSLCPQLESLEVNYKFNKDTTEEYEWPDSLTSLSLEGPFSDMDIVGLPRTLVQLSLISSRYASEILSKDGFKQLPPKLTVLDLRMDLKDFHPVYLPRLITHLHLDFGGVYTKRMIDDGLLSFDGSFWPELHELTIKCSGSNDIGDLDTMTGSCLKDLPLSLEKLNINVGQLTDQNTLDFSYYLKCTDMSIHTGNDIDEVFLSRLPPLLQTLKIASLIQKTDIPSLKYLTHLKDLFLRKPEIATLSLDHLPTNLSTLRIQHPDDVESVHYDLTNFPYLRAFCIYSLEIDEDRNGEFGTNFDFAKSHFTWSEQIKYIRLSGWQTIAPQDFINLPRELKSFVTFLEDDTSHLKDLPPTLEDLYMHYERVDSSDLQNLPTTLKYLSLAKGYDDKRTFDISILNNLENLEFLEITNFEIDSSQLNLSRFKKLRKITFNFSTPYIYIYNESPEDIIERKRRETKIDQLKNWAQNQSIQVDIHIFLPETCRTNYSVNAEVTRKTLRKFDERAGVLMTEEELNNFSLGKESLLIV